MSYHEDLVINRNLLEEEWEDQSLRFIKYSEEWAKAILERDRARENLDLVRAQVDFKIRANPAAYGFEVDRKPTEGAISAMILQTDEYGNASREYQEASYNVNVLASAKEAFNHRKSALENLTKLWLGSFWSKVEVPPEARAAREGATREANEQAINKSPRLRSRLPQAG